MPLPDDITRDPSPRIGRDELGNIMVLTSDGLAATCRGGKWQAGFLFSARSWLNDFTQVTDEQEVEQILHEATDALRQFGSLHADYFE